MYTFVYEEQHGDEWRPNVLHVESPSLEEAFGSLGFVIESQQLTVRNINYGVLAAMREEIDRVDAYWREHQEAE